MNEQPLNPEPAPAPRVVIVGPDPQMMTFAERIAAGLEPVAPVLSPLNQAAPAAADTSTAPPPPTFVPYTPGNRSRRRRHLGRAGMVPGDEAARIKAAQEAERAKKKAKDKETAKMKKRQRARG